VATIKSQLSLNDGMSAVLKKITFALDTTLGTFEQMQRASGEAIDVDSITKARGLLVEANADFEQMVNEMARAAREQEQLNESINRGTSAADGMLKKIVSLVGAYASVSAIKSFSISSMEAANTQINAQVQLRTVLENMGAMDSYEALANSLDGNELGNTLELDTAGALKSYDAFANGVDEAELGNVLELDTAGALDNYTSVADDIGNNTLENTLTLNTAEAMDNYDTFAAGVTSNTLEVGLVVQADNSQAMSAYDAIVAKASEIQGAGIYGDEAMIAGAAEFATYFKDANAILSMMDTLTDYAMGMSGGGALDTTAMVDYATGLGKIMSGSYDAMTKKGFEFTDTQKAVIEGTATEAQIVSELGAEYLNMSSDMQAAATINNVIAEGWGGLYETMSNTPEGKLIQLNNTLGDIQENVGAGIYPAVVNLVDMVQSNTPQIESLATGVATMLGFIITVLTGIANGALTVATTIMNNWSWIGPIITGAAVALGLYWAATEGITIAQGIAAVATAGYHAVVNFLSIGFGVLTGNTAAASAAVFTFNSALLASPITWVILCIIALIAIIYAAVGAINHFAGTSVSATGIIAGVFATLGAHIINTFVVPVWNYFAAIANFIGNVFNDPVAAVEVLIYDMALTVIGYIANMAHAIEDVINKIPGVTVDITSGLDNFYSGLEQAQQAVKDESGWVEYVGKMDFIDYGDAASAGYEFGQGVEDKIGGFFDGLGYTPGSIDDYTNAAMGGSFAMDDLGSDVGDIAENTGSMAKSVDMTGEELKYLRDIAERDAINRFTTAEVKIDMTGMTNKIDGGADLDGVIRELTDGFTEALLTAAEGVHA